MFEVKNKGSGVRRKWIEVRGSVDGGKLLSDGVRREWLEGRGSVSEVKLLCDGWGGG